MLVVCTSRLELECWRLVMTDVVIQHELVRMKVRKRLAWILFRRQRISLRKKIAVKMIARVTLCAELT